MELDTDLSPCRLIEYGGETSPRFGLMLLDLWPAHFFDGRAVEGNGYTWERIVRHLVGASAPELGERLEYAPEADMFVVRSDDPDALRTIAILIRACHGDLVKLAELVTKVGRVRRNSRP